LKVEQEVEIDVGKEVRYPRRRTESQREAQSAGEDSGREMFIGQAFKSSVYIFPCI
jgi:hypothetical protein